MQFEKLGSFYLGKTYDLAANQLRDELVLYDSKDLTTHAVIIGMTGSGKTGLGVGLLEEAALDHIPAIAIDPKGDLGNLMLTFPRFRAEDFEPWVNPQEAANKGKTVSEYSAAQAALWKKGLGEWGQDADRVRKLKEAAEFSIYTPGSSAGLPMSVLASFRAPPQVVRDDSDAFPERVQATATGVLALLGIDADPITSREHILISNLLQHHWMEERDLDLPALIATIQDPPFGRVGVMDIDSFYSSKDRFALAMKLNNLLAAPGFSAWTQGMPLDVQRLLYTQSGKPRLSIVSIAHLSDNERMFFVSMLLNELIAWMRAQPGTGSLRALLYMDEVFGFLPPIANPPTKQLFLTLLKQARAYGLGLVLATQNPVDLDYKALSNAGTWFIGRLQTERDKARLMEGLEGVATGGKFDRGATERTIAGLKKRVFLLHNVHEEEPAIFNTRWVMSYLAGPMTRDHIRRLMAGREELSVPAARVKKDTAAGKRPALPPNVTEYFLPAASGGELIYHPHLIASAEVGYVSARYNVDHRESLTLVSPLEDSAVPVDWHEALAFDPARLVQEPVAGGAFAELPSGSVHELSDAEKAFKRWLRNERPLMLYRSAVFKMTSKPEESEGDFRVRLQQMANEKRDIDAGKLREKYTKKKSTLDERLRRAEQRIESEADQAQQKKLDAAVAVGSAILDAFLGRRVSRGSASRVGTAVKTAGRVRKESSDVKRAKETADKVRQQILELEQKFEGELDALDDRYDAQDEELTEIPVKSKTTDIHVRFLALGWAPFVREAGGALKPAFSLS